MSYDKCLVILDLCGMFENIRPPIFWEKDTQKKNKKMIITAKNLLLDNPIYYELDPPSPGEPNFYRNQQLFHSFFRQYRVNRLVQRDQNIVYLCCDNNEFLQNRFFEGSIFIDDYYCIEKKFSSMFEFYNHIGFDYKLRVYRHDPDDVKKIISWIKKFDYPQSYYFSMPQTH